MTPLAVPTPQVTWKTGPAPELQQPVEVGLPAVAYPDGSVLAPDNGLATLGFFVYRTAGAGEEIWNEDEQEWRTAPAGPESLGALKPLALAPASARGAPYPWRGVLVAAGEKDKSGSDRFAAASAGGPRYRLRAYAKGRRQGVEYGGLSGASAELAFTSADEGKRFEIELDPESIKQCTRVTLKLRNAALADVAFVRLSATGGNEVEIANQTASGTRLATIRLAANGDIVLTPAAGRRVTIDGDAYVDRLFYRPGGTGGHVVL